MPPRSLDNGQTERTNIRTGALSYPTMKDIDFLEHGGAADGSPPVIRHLGYDLPMDNPRERHFQWVLLALAVRYVPSIPHDLPDWKRELAFEHWRAGWNLPRFEDARRLAYIVDRHRGALTHDLLVVAGLDLGEEWRARRWARLLDIIDRLPAHSHYSAAVAADEEHARLLAEAMAARKAEGDDEKDAGPAITTWSPEVAVLTRVVDELKSVRYAVLASQLGKKAGDPPRPEPRPVTAIQAAIKRAEHARRKAAHESLVARVLPHKAAVKAQSED